MKESCHTYERDISHIRRSHFTHMKESCHTYEGGMSRRLDRDSTMVSFKVTTVPHGQNSGREYLFRAPSSEKAQEWIEIIRELSKAAVYAHTKAQKVTHTYTHFTATHCNTLQRTATHCNTLQRTATHCSIIK